MIVLLDVQRVVLKLDYCSLVPVDIAVVRGAEHCDHHWEIAGPAPSVHLIPVWQ